MRTLRWLAALALLGAAALYGVSYRLSGALIAPAQHPIGPPPADLSAEAFSLPSDSGARLAGWLVPGRRGHGVVILAHMFHGSRLAMLDRARFLARAGYSVVLFDFQAHGESTGGLLTAGFRERHDVRAVYRWTRQRFPTERLALYGVSLGGAAILLNAPQLSCDALIVEMVYSSIQRAVENRVRIRLGPAALLLAPLLTWQFRQRTSIDPTQMRPLERIGAVNAPILVIAGSEDQHTMIDESRAMFAAARQPKQWWEVAGAAHQDLHAYAQAQYENKLLEFLERHLR